MLQATRVTKSDTTEQGGIDEGRFPPHFTENLKLL